MIARRHFAFALLWITVGVLAGCNRLPGKPTEEERWKAPTEVTDFKQLYGQNCAGCHGTDGRLGAARPLNDPLYLSLVKPEQLRQVVANGVPGTTMPAFSLQAGGSLTDKQMDALVGEMQSQWGRPDGFKTMSLPPYSLQDVAATGSAAGDQGRGLMAYQTYCAQCHGADGKGSDKGGSIVDPNFLSMVSDQSLRTTIIAGRSDLGMPDWRNNVSGRPMSPQEVSDVVAWLAAQRPVAASQQRASIANPAPSPAPDARQVPDTKERK